MQGIPRTEVYGLILAGGRGALLWPLSRRQSPKPFLSIGCGRSLLQQTVHRILPLIPLERLYVSIGEQFVAEAVSHVTGIPLDNILSEPISRNTAPAIGFAAMTLKQRHGDGVMAVLPADHYIEDAAALRRTVAFGACLLDQYPEALLTVGVPAVRPETGYGYIRRGSAVSGAYREAFWVERFVEKPDRAKAEAFVADGSYFWNSGMFIWGISGILNALETHLPLLHEALCVHVQGAGQHDSRSAGEFFRSVESCSIDYGVMEKTSDAIVIPADIGWSDVGTWDVVATLAEGPPAETVVCIETEDTWVRAGKRVVVVIGVPDAIIVDTDDALLVCARSRTQDVRRATEELERRQLSQFL